MGLKDYLRVFTHARCTLCGKEFPRAELTRNAWVHGNNCHPCTAAAIQAMYAAHDAEEFEERVQRELARKRAEQEAERRLAREQDAYRNSPEKT